MIITMHKDATPIRSARCATASASSATNPHEMPGAQRTAICITGNKGPVDPALFTRFTGVADAVAISQPYKLVSREIKPDPTVIEVRGVRIGGGCFCVMAGPCSVESRDQVLSTAEHVKKHGAPRAARRRLQAAHQPLRIPGPQGRRPQAPRRSARPDRAARHHRGEGRRDPPLVAQYADVLQIGARNMQNFSLLERVGELGKPVMLKRGLPRPSRSGSWPPSTSSRAATAASSSASAASARSRR